jgi:hypothetical protein
MTLIRRLFWFGVYVPYALIIIFFNSFGGAIFTARKQFVFLIKIKIAKFKQLGGFKWPPQ